MLSYITLPEGMRSPQSLQSPLAIKAGWTSQDEAPGMSSLETDTLPQQYTERQQDQGHVKSVAHRHRRTGTWSHTNSKPQGQHNHATQVQKLPDLTLASALGQKLCCLLNAKQVCPNAQDIFIFSFSKFTTHLTFPVFLCSTVADNAAALCCRFEHAGLHPCISTHGPFQVSGLSS